jgi:predicted HTH transcriptional regulator
MEDAGAAVSEEEYRSIIYAGAEDRNREYKASFPWDRSTQGETMAKVTKTILAMSNLRDGGHIVIGVEDGTPCQPVGMQADHLKTFSYDDVADFVQKYADPYVRFALDSISLDGLNFIVIAVTGFDEFPVVCRTSYGSILAESAVYTRPQGGRPRSAPISNYADMRELLDIAVERGIRRFIELRARVGLTGPTDAELFEQELGDFL